MMGELSLFLYLDPVDSLVVIACTGLGRYLIPMLPFNLSVMYSNLHLMIGANRETC